MQYISLEMAIVKVVISCVFYSFGQLRINLQPKSNWLDVKKQILYWTDINNNRIGRLLLAQKKREPNFIVEAGVFPDGLSLDTLHNRFYWGSKESGIGWADLSNRVPHLVKTSNVTEAVEVDAENGVLYYGFWEKAYIGKIPLKQLVNAKKNSTENVLFAGAGHPGVIKIFTIKN